MNKTMLKAYTLLELTITMLIAALVIGITFTVYGLVSRYHYDFNRKNEELVALTALDKGVARDIFKAEKVIKAKNELICAGIYDTIKYAFVNKLVVRSSTKTDTFYINCSPLIAAFSNKNLKVETQTPDSLVNTISFTVTYQGRRISYVYHKYYSAEQLINYTDAIH